MDLFDLAQSRAERDAGLSIVANHNTSFMARGLAAIEAMEGYMTGEQIRCHLICKGIEPANPHCYGALICTAIRKGLLKGTGKYTAMASIKSHARKTEIYSRNNGGFNALR